MQYDVQVQVRGVMAFRARLAYGFENVPDETEECCSVRAVPERYITGCVGPVGDQIEDGEQGIRGRQDDGCPDLGSFADYPVCLEGLGMGIMA